MLSRQVLDLMVNEQLQLQYAASNGLRVSESQEDDGLDSHLHGEVLEAS